MRLHRDNFNRGLPGSNPFPEVPGAPRITRGLPAGKMVRVVTDIEAKGDAAVTVQYTVQVAGGVAITELSTNTDTPVKQKSLPKNTPVNLKKKSLPTDTPVKQKSQPIDLNDASLEDLLKVPLIGLASADAILAKKPFRTWSEVGKCKLIGAGKVESLQNYFRLGREVDVKEEEEDDDERKRWATW